MNRHRSGGGLPRRFLTPTLALALAATVLATPVALADTGPDPVSEAALDAATARMAAERPPATESDRAFAEAKATGKNVPVDSLTTEYTETSATPDGHFAMTAHPDQQRTKRSGTWQSLDANLAANQDGTFSPKSSAGQLVLSKGGEGPLATMASADGKKLSLTAPFPLTTPTVSGDSVTYPGVAPDIDLKVTATKAGGLTTILVVKTQAATTDPLLRNLHFGATTEGVTLAGDQAGNLTATAADGKPRFLAPTPLMWDSTSTTTSSVGISTSRALSPRDTTTTPADQPAKASTASTPAGPGTVALSAAMPARADSNGIDLTPDQNLLTHGTAPYFIDPAWKPAPTTSANAWTWVQSGEPGTSNYNRTGSSDSDYPGVGVCGDYGNNGGSCKPSSAYRSFFQFDTHALNGTVIHSATITFQEYVSADWNCTNTYGVDLYLTGGINAQTTWGYQPGQLGNSLGTKVIGGSGRDGCYGNVPFDYDVTGTFQTYAPTYPNLTFGLYGSETNQNAFKRVTPQPTLSVWYDRVPNVPTNPNAYPAPKTLIPQQTNQACGGSPATAAWLGAGSTQQGAVSLRTTVSSPVQDQLYSWTHIWDYNAKGGVTDIDSGLSGLTPNNGTASFTVRATNPDGSSKITDGHTYGWSAAATDSLAPWSAATPSCFFKVDTSPPRVDFPPTVADPTKQFPPSDSGQTPQIYAGNPGDIPLILTDPPASSGLASSGVICVYWSWDPELQRAQSTCGATPPTKITVTPPHWGTNIVFVQAKDNAGNLSPVAQYSFYAPWNPNGKPPVFGDVTGDAVPDIVAADKAGNLRAYTVPGNSAATSPATSLAATAANSPDHDSWANYHITHRGTLTGGLNVDDLIVHKDNAPTLWVYQNPGTGAFGKSYDVRKPACDTAISSTCAGYNATDWSTTLQIAAVGDPTTTDNDISKQFKNKTGLFTVETSPDGDGALWYYPVLGGSSLGAPHNLSATGWKGWELISPGDWAGQGRPGLWARNPGGGDLRGYTFVLGKDTATDPAGKSVTYDTITTLDANNKIGSGNNGTWVTMGSDGDLSGNGHAALWGITASGAIQIWTGGPISTSDGPGYDFKGPLTVGTTAIAADQWQLAGTTADASTVNPATVYNTVGWTTDHNNGANSAASFSGNGYLRTTSSAVDSSQSYTVSAWVKYNGTPSTDQVLLAQGGTNHQAYYLSYAASAKSWQFSTTTDDNATGTRWVSVDAPASGNWTQLTATYNADTDAMTLYVNGAYAGSAYNKTVWAAPYGLSIGAAANPDNSSYGNVNGAVSNVRTYPYALTPEQAKALYNS
ncbi:hypothetical protein CFP65_5558 [Kitasatospora sp. MMS16-BH015]|uniref:LamG domain-containing protein n=1 Tax=Kitasatospora sp. MMS16-BH015 TaxID=2018025 RepID=UPI000CA12F01|nr:LamG domain-containing protein [Kitasatospora sp. MMS16-BH015]AUG80255.1 hypothetical protein CFP65_5558 [Kitasatospora sp. MMS16-BH015]